MRRVPTGQMWIKQSTLRCAVLICLLLLLHGCSSSQRNATQKGAAVLPDDKAAASHSGMIRIKGGSFQMGSDDGMPDEAPIHDVTLRPFWIDAHEVTVTDFSRFVTATHYQTDAERAGSAGVFDLKTKKWGKVGGANWRHPDGSQSNANAVEPVCQVSWNDALAYAKWRGQRLPTEAEWEFAARGGLVAKKYAWGDELRPGGKPVANWWQGHFPEENTGEDGYIMRAPVGMFPPNGFGLYDVAGNVWEWCADFYDEEYYAKTPNSDPPGPDLGKERVIRGGSWMCSENYCTNYRTAARSHATPDSGLNNTGFRCASD